MPRQVFRLPEFAQPTYDPVSQRTLVRQIEQWLTSLGSEIASIETISGGPFAPLVHTHVPGEILGLDATIAAAIASIPLSTITGGGASTGQVPVWNGSQWSPGSVSGGGGLANAFAKVTDGSNTANAVGIDTLRVRSANNRLSVAVFENDATFGDNVRLTLNENLIDHDALANFVAAEHVDHSGVSVLAGTGLTGGGTIEANRTLNLADTAVTPNTYGDAATVAQVTVDQQGRLTLAAGVAIEIVIGSVTGLTAALAAKIETSLIGAANGVASLDASAKVPQNQLPAIAISDTFVVASQAAMLALTAETGDVAVRTDTDESYILSGTDPSVLLDWTMLLFPAGGGGTVTSVDSGTGLTGGPITITGTLSLANTAVTPATYGAADTVGQFTVDQQGRLTSALDVPIVLAIAGVTGLTAALAAKVETSLVGAAGGLATLDGSGLVPVAQLPPLSITDTFVVASQAAMLALTAETGDVAVRTDTDETYILRGTDPSVLADWELLRTPTGAGTVTSVGSGTGLTGGPITGSGSLSLDLTYTDARYAAIGDLALYLPLTGGALTGFVTNTEGFRSDAEFGFLNYNPTNGTANFAFRWLADQPTIRIGGTGTGSSAAFKIMGAGDFTRMTLDSSGRLNLPGVATATVPTLQLLSTNPQFEIVNSGAAADAGRWNWHAAADRLQLRPLTDAGSGGGNVLAFYRSGVSPTVAEHGSPLSRFVGDGSSAVGATGHGVELLVSAGFGRIFSYDRTAARYMPLNLRGDQISLAHNGATAQLVTQDHSASGKSSGIQVRHADTAFYDAGFNVMPFTAITTSLTLARTHVGGILRHSSVSAHTLTIPASTDTTIPIGATFTVTNHKTGALTIAVGAGTTLYTYDGSGEPTAGGRTLAAGGVMTLYKAGAGEWWCWGNVALS